MHADRHPEGRWACRGFQPADAPHRLLHPPRGVDGTLGVGLAGEPHQHGVTPHLISSPPLAYAIANNSAKVTSRKPVSSSAPALPRAARVSVRRVNPEMSMNARVPSSTRTRWSGASASQSRASLGTYGDRTASWSGWMLPGAGRGPAGPARAPGPGPGVLGWPVVTTRAVSLVRGHDLGTCGRDPVDDGGDLVVGPGR
jgi:hypothetical protein